MNIVVELRKFSSLKGLLYAVYLDCTLPTYGVWLYHWRHSLLYVHTHSLWSITSFLFEFPVHIDILFILVCTIPHTLSPLLLYSSIRHINCKCFHILQWLATFQYSEWVWVLLLRGQLFQLHSMSTHMVTILPQELHPTTTTALINTGQCQRVATILLKLLYTVKFENIHS